LAVKIKYNYQVPLIMPRFDLGNSKVVNIMSDKENTTAPPPQSPDSSSAEGQSVQAEVIPISPEDSLAIDLIFEFLKRGFNVDFSHYRRTTVMRRLIRRIGICNTDNFQDYLNILKSNPEELQNLYNDLLLSYTEFFRDPFIFEALNNYVFPKLVAHGSVKSPIRIWVPGCSTGEEVYSIAIALYEFMEESKSKVPVQLFGTDLVGRHISKARIGIYPDKIRKTVSAERINRFFDETENGLKVIQHIREMCVFAIQDFTKDPPFPQMDLVSCRNVLIYLDATFQQRVIPLFHFSLKRSGFLLLGTSETLSSFPQFFTFVDKKANLYKKLNTGARHLYRFPVGQVVASLKSPVTPGGSNSPSTEESPDITEQITTLLLESYVPPGVLIDYNMNIRQFFGHTFPFLEPASGEASLKLSKMAGDGLMPDLYVAIEEAKSTGCKVAKKNIKFKQKDNIYTTNVSVLPVRESGAENLSFLILFEESCINSKPDESTHPYSNSTESEFGKLKLELERTKDYLQSIIEAKDEVNQELWASNEEVLSTNEELQSVNEELEASKEELESGNEELIALNEELHETNQLLISSRDFAENLLETANAIVITLDMEGRITKFNKHAEQLTGYKREESIGRNFFELFIPPRDRNLIPILFSEVLEQMPSMSNHENPIVIKGGKELLIRWSNNVLKDNSQNIKGVLSIGMDITKRSKAEIALKNSESKLLNAQYVAQMGDFTWNIQSGEVLWSMGMHKLLKYATDEKIEYSKVNAEIHHPDDLEMVTKWLTESIASGREVLIPKEYRLICKDGEIIHVRTNGIIKKDGGSPLVLFGTCINITEQKLMALEKSELEKQYRQAQKIESIGRLAGGVAHDLNNMLAPILGFSEILLEEMPHNDERREYVSEIACAGFRSRDLVRQLLAFSRKQTLKYKPVDLIKVVAGIRQMLRRTIRENVEILIPKSNQPFIIIADTGQVEQIILNICINAEDAMPQGGSLTIEIHGVIVSDENQEQYLDTKPGSYAMLSIRDTGCGMDEETQSNLFEPFFTTKGDMGTGLGLATVFGIVKQHNGSINFTSDKNSGTTFEILLPLALDQPSEGVPTNDSTALDINGDETILLVEDTEQVRHLAYKVLIRRGYNVIVAKNGKEAIELMNSFEKPIHLLLTDVIMPGMNGRELFIHAIKQYPNMKVLFMSGYAGDVISSSGVLENEINFIQKPFKIKVFTTKVRQILDSLTLGLPK
jgi:two-component system, chemotaxis family, CheB/CheR fusion protein